MKPIRLADRPTTRAKFVSSTSSGSSHDYAYVWCVSVFQSIWLNRFTYMRFALLSCRQSNFVHTSILPAIFDRDFHRLRSAQIDTRMFVWVRMIECQIQRVYRFQAIFSDFACNCPRPTYCRQNHYVTLYPILFTFSTWPPSFYCAGIPDLAWQYTRAHALGSIAPENFRLRMKMNKFVGSTSLNHGCVKSVVCVRVLAHASKNMRSDVTVIVASKRFLTSHGWNFEVCLISKNSHKKHQ